MKEPATLLSNFYEDFHRQRKKAGTVVIPERLDFIRTEVGTGKDVVELGCRFGDILALVEAGNRLSGVDVDRAALEICRQRVKADLQVANLNETLPFPDGAFDAVILTEVLEHLPYPQITLGEISRILRPGGVLVGSVPNAVKLFNRLMFLFSGRVEIDPTHLHHFSRASLAATLGKYFGDIVIRPISGRCLRFSPHLFANYLLFRARKAG